MKSDDVTREPARAIFRKVEPTANYLTRLRLRMGNRGFTDGDPLWDFRDASRARASRLQRRSPTAGIDPRIFDEWDATISVPVKPAES